MRGRIAGALGRAATPWGITILFTAAWLTLTIPSLPNSPLIGPDMYVIIGNLRADHSAAAVWSWFSGHWVQGAEYYRPIPSLLHWADYMIWGEAPYGWRLTNALLLAATFPALTWLCARGLQCPWAGPVAAVALIRFHPAVEMPIYPAWRTDLLCGLFLLLATAAALEYIRDGAWKRLWLALGMLLLALMSKEVAVVWPAVAAIAVLLMGRNRHGLILLGSSFALTGAFWLLRVHLLGHPLLGQLPPQVNFPMETQLAFFYRTLVDPLYINFTVTYPSIVGLPGWWVSALFWQTVLEDTAFVAANVILAVRAPRLLALLWAWRAITYLPAMPFVRLYPFYYYIPALGSALIYGLAAALLVQILLARLMKSRQYGSQSDNATEDH